MAEPYLSEIRIFSFGYPPRGWAFCNGQTLPINQNQALFALLGTTYGGNGQTTFQLPNLQGRAAMHRTGGFPLGAVAGEATHTLQTTEIPLHTHTLGATTATATTGLAQGATIAAPVSTVGSIYAAGAADITMAPQAIANAGGGQPHENMQPYLALSFCIAMQGIFPSRS
ncbi:MAG: tail fiber protein [Capsulimonas sp.]|uniref:phage tail protein n=1 Tax=Capsulimonas sp. TaxID=2494211 RepID=UPI0032656487